MTEKGRQFLEMFREELGENHKVMPIISKMVIMLEPMEEFDDMMEVCTGVENYGDFLTEKEAEHITEHFVNYDKTRGAKWPKAEMLFETVKSVGGTVEEPRKYNKWVLFTVMNMIHADYGGVCRLWFKVQNTQRYATRWLLLSLWIRTETKASVPTMALSVKILFQF